MFSCSILWQGGAEREGRGESIVFLFNIEAGRGGGETRGTAIVFLFNIRLADLIGECRRT